MPRAEKCPRGETDRPSGARQRERPVLFEEKEPRKPAGQPAGQSSGASEVSSGQIKAPEQQESLRDDLQGSETLMSKDH